MRACARTDTGCVRSMNQDFVFCSTEPVGSLPNLFIVADGMGGHHAGDLASRYAVETFVDYIRHAEGDALVRIIDQGIQAANEAVLKKSLEDEELSGMGTTLVVCYIENNQLFVANIGDSRLYLIGKEINQVTDDHSYVAAMMRAGELTPEQARNHPEKNVITRAVGVSREIKADFFEVDLQQEDRILMCSDGLSNMVEDDMLKEIILQNSMDDIDQILVNKANENGGMDNISVIIIAPFEEEASRC